MAWKTLVGCLAIGTMLSGCADLEERREQRRAEIAAKDMATCKSFGFKVGQPEYKQCIVNEQRYRKTQSDIAWNRIQQQRQSDATPEDSTFTGPNTYYRTPVFVPIPRTNPFGN